MATEAALPFVADNGEKTFQYDETLPSLPVPPLEQTLAKYLDSVRVHVTEEEYHQTEFLVQQFASGVGKELHRKLVERSKKERNWLEKWWEDHAYLEGRFPIAPFVSCTGPGPYMDHYMPPQDGTQIERAALSLYYFLMYWKLIRKEQLRPEKGKDGSPLAMNTYRRAYNTCRIPGEKMDHLKFYFKTEQEGDTPKHVLIMCRGHMFFTDVIDENYEPITPLEFEKKLQYVRTYCDNIAEGPGLGSLTGDQRTRWYQNRQYLINLHPNNEKNLELIQSSLCAVVLEDINGENRTKIMTEALCGNSTNRWFDKSFNSIIFQDGTFGNNFEHCPFDAMVLVSATYYVDRHIYECKGKWQGTKAIRNLPQPREVVFQLDDKMYKAIQTAKELFLENAAMIDGFAPRFQHFGKNIIRKYKLHPDAVVQLSLQLGYYRIYKRPAPTYETAATRRFYHARTETVRSCTVEAIDWCKAMLDSNSTNQNRHRLFMQALQKQVQMMNECTNAQGCDRHLYGMYLIAQKEGIPMPLLYTDKSFTKSGGGGNFILSTSFVGYTTVQGGVAPMCENGYGVFYQIRPTCVPFFISCWKRDKETNCQLMFDSISQSLMDIKNLVEDTVPPAKV